MLRTPEELHDHTIGADDGVIGHVEDLFLDDDAWVVRSLVVDTGCWLFGKKVPISPMAIGKLNSSGRLLPVSITKEQVNGSPDVDSGGYWGGGMYPGMMLPGTGGFGSPQAIREGTQHARARAEQARDAHFDPRLRSCKAITGCHIHASDGDIGHVSGLLIDDEAWAVRCLMVDTSNWWVGHAMLIAPRWIEGVSWAEDTVSIKLTRQGLKDAPAFDPAGPLEREDEACLHEHHGRSAYWASEAKPVTEATHV